MRHPIEQIYHLWYLGFRQSLQQPKVNVWEGTWSPLAVLSRSRSFNVIHLQSPLSDVGLVSENVHGVHDRLQYRLTQRGADL